MELASGFVLAVIIGAVLLADRLGGSEEVARRFYQIALGAALALTVIAGTDAFVLKDRAELLTSSSSFDAPSASNRVLIATTIRVVAGVVGVLVGLDLMRRMRTLSLGILLGAVLLILSIGQAEPLSDYFRLLGSGSTLADRSTRAVNFIVLLGGSIVLLGYGFSRWGNDALDAVDEPTYDAEEDPPGIP